jgi:Leucine-rich repeat (LRR) protein
MEPAAGRSTEDEDGDNPYLNDEFMDTLRSNAEQQTSSSSRKYLRSDDGGVVADVNRIVNLGVIHGSTLERASKVPSLAMPILKVGHRDLSNNSRGGTTTAGVAASDFQSMPLRSQSKGHVRVGSGSIPLVGMVVLKTSNSSGSFSRLRGGQGHRKTQSHSNNDDLANAVFPPAAIVARTSPPTTSNHHLDDIHALKNGMSRKGSGGVRVIHGGESNIRHNHQLKHSSSSGAAAQQQLHGGQHLDLNAATRRKVEKKNCEKTMVDIGHIVMDDIAQDEDLFTASHATLASQREVVFVPASTPPVSNSTSSSINKRDLVGDDWLRSGQAEQFRHFMDGATTTSALSKAAGGGTSLTRGRSTGSAGRSIGSGSHSQSRAIPSADIPLDDFLMLEDGTMPLMHVLKAIERASSSGGGLSRSVSVDTTYVLDNSNKFIEKHHVKTQIPSAIAAPGVDDHAAAILAGVSEQHGSDSSRRRKLRQAEMAVDASAKNMNKVTLCSQRKRLDLTNYNLKKEDIPVNAICSKPLGKDLHKMILAGNKLMTVPDRFVMELTGLHTLDLQQCDLFRLPSVWNLKLLRRLILSHNKLDEFLGEVRACLAASILVGHPLSPNSPHSQLSLYPFTFGLFVGSAERVDRIAISRHVR